MRIGAYIKEHWKELWNPDSSAWQRTDRILFVALPIVSLVLSLIPSEPEPQSWRSTMLSFAWVIPLVVWGLFLLVVVPYRLVSRYHCKHESVIQELLSVYLAGDKLKTAVFNRHDDGEGATALYKEWGGLVAKVFTDNPVELGVKRLIGIKVESTDLKTPIPDSWKDDDLATGVYITLDVQLRKLNSLIQELHRDRG